MRCRELLIIDLGQSMSYKERIMTPQVKPSVREARRLQTRERILGAAIAEFKRSGMAGADVGAIVTAAGVAHGTFYFHFPTKEHVLLELECRATWRSGHRLQPSASVVALLACRYEIVRRRCGYRYRTVGS